MTSSLGVSVSKGLDPIPDFLCQDWRVATLGGVRNPVGPGRAPLHSTQDDGETDPKNDHTDYKKRHVFLPLRQHCRIPRVNP